MTEKTPACSQQKNPMVLRRQYLIAAQKMASGNVSNEDVANLLALTQEMLRMLSGGDEQIDLVLLVDGK